MCNLYSETSAQDYIRKLFRVIRDRTGNLPVLREIYPATMAPVVRKGDDGARELVILRWGFVLPQEGTVPKDVTNARSDKVATSSFWKSSFVERRCLVPVTSFCEWTDKPDAETGKKRKVWFRPRDTELFAFAGLWRHWRGNYKSELGHSSCAHQIPDRLAVEPAMRDRTIVRTSTSATRNDLSVDQLIEGKLRLWAPGLVEFNCVEVRHSNLNAAMFIANTEAVTIDNVGHDA